MSNDPKDPDDDGTDHVIIPFRRRWKNGRAGAEGQSQAFPDGTVVQSMARGWALWTFKDHPITQSTCVGCFRQRSGEHESCGFEDCDCFCVRGKLWPLWALLGLRPPEGFIPPQLLGLSLPEEAAPPAEQAQPEEAGQPARTRSVRWLGVSAAVAAVALAIVIAALSARREETVSSSAPDAALSAANVPGLGKQANNVLPSAVLVQAVVGGMKMPDRPEPNWARPGKGGFCTYPPTWKSQSDEMFLVVLRGSCWFVAGARPPGMKTCPSNYYDPPPEVLKEPLLEDLRDKCLKPQLTAGNSAEPH
ncbi:MAG TPA: hypothetical protein VK447_01695 [Myxococcaceae bacterium]|nr:hypothetical protein [Myxococcaceae bacterium]